MSTRKVFEVLEGTSCKKEKARRRFYPVKDRSSRVGGAPHMLMVRANTCTLLSKVMAPRTQIVSVGNFHVEFQSSTEVELSLEKGSKQCCFTYKRKIKSSCIDRSRQTGENLQNVSSLRTMSAKFVFRDFNWAFRSRFAIKLETIRSLEYDILLYLMCNVLFFYEFHSFASPIIFNLGAVLVSWNRKVGSLFKNIYFKSQ